MTTLTNRHVPREHPYYIHLVGGRIVSAGWEISALRSEASEHGDLEQVSLCDRALDGDETAMTACTDVIDDAAAMSAAD